MTTAEILQILGITLAVGAGLSILIGNVFYVLRSQSGKIQKEQFLQLKEDFATCESKHQDSQKDIHRLQGQIDILRNIPLKEIDKGIKGIGATNKQILETLKNSAATLRVDHQEDVRSRKTVARQLKEAI